MRITINFTYFEPAAWSYNRDNGDGNNDLHVV